MKRSVSDKLQISPHTEVLLRGSRAQLALLGPLPDGVTVVDGVDRDTEGVIVAFLDDRASLDAFLAESAPNASSFRAAWICYLKGGRADINRDSIWEAIGEHGLTLVANVSIDDVWSAVRFKRL